MRKNSKPVDDAAHRARRLHRYDTAQVIEIDGMPAGLLKAHRTDAESVVVQIQILPALQGRGIGERALPVKLKVIKGNSAKRLYARPGFEIVGEEEPQFYMRRSARTSAETEAE